MTKGAYPDRCCRSNDSYNQNQEDEEEEEEEEGAHPSSSPSSPSDYRGARRAAPRGGTVRDNNNNKDSHHRHYNPKRRTITPNEEDEDDNDDLIRIDTDAWGSNVTDGGGGSASPGTTTARTGPREEEEEEEGRRRTGLLQQYYSQEVVRALLFEHSDSSGRRLPTTVLAASHYDEWFEALRKSPETVLDETPFERYFMEFWEERENGGGGKDETTAGDGMQQQGGAEGDNKNKKKRQAICQTIAKLANHWKIRKDLFGSERFHLPMILPCPPPEPPPPARGSRFGRTRSGCREDDENRGMTKCTSKRIMEVERRVREVPSALSAEEDMPMINTGWVSILPATCDPVKGRCCISSDRTLLGTEWDRKIPAYEERKLRNLFYFLHVMCTTRPESFTNGMVVFAMPAAPTPISICLAEGINRIIRGAFPIPKFEFHGLFLPSKISSLMSLVSSVSSYATDIWVRRSGSTTSRMHFGLTDEQVIQSLIRCGGFNRADIPVWMGGTDNWDTTAFLKWLKSQYHAEQRSHVSEETRKLKIRIDSMKRSQAKREREKLLVEELKEEAEELRQSNTVINQENEMLEQMILHAQALGRQAESEDLKKLDLLFGCSEEEKDEAGSIAALIPEAEELCMLSLFGDEDGQEQDYDGASCTASVRNDYDKNNIHCHPQQALDGVKGSSAAAYRHRDAIVDELDDDDIGILEQAKTGGIDIPASVPVAEELCNMSLFGDG